MEGSRGGQSVGGRLSTIFDVGASQAIDAGLVRLRLRLGRQQRGAAASGAAVIRIAITQAAYDAICATSLGSVGYENAANERGERLIWLDLAGPRRPRSSQGAKAASGLAIRCPRQADRPIADPHRLPQDAVGQHPQAVQGGVRGVSVVLLQATQCFPSWRQFCSVPGVVRREATDSEHLLVKGNAQV